MAITGISSIDNKQIIAAGALSAISANQALITSGGDSLQGLYDTVSTNSGSWTGGGSYPSNITADTILLSAEVTPGDSDLARVDISPDGISISHPEQGYGNIDATTIQNWDSTYETVNTNSASWTGGGGGSVTSPLGTISVDGSNIEATNSAVGTVVTPSASALLGDNARINGPWDSPSVFSFTLPTTGGTLYAIQNSWYGTNTFNFSGKDLNGNIITGSMTVPGQPGTTATADLNEIVSDISAQGTQGTVTIDQFYVTSPSASNSGVYELAWKSDVPTGNVFTGYNTYTSGTTSYSATVDTDYKLTAGNATYSLIGAYTNANNKFNKVTGSITLFEYSGYYEMGNKAYSADIFGTTGADRTEVYTNQIYIGFYFGYQYTSAKADKVYLTFDATQSGTVNDSNWNLLSSNNNSYTFVRYCKPSDTNNGNLDTYFNFNYGSFGTITNATASATLYSALNLKELAFKDDLTGGSVPDEVMSAASAVSANSANWNETTDTLSANSGAWGGNALPISAGAGISLSMVNGVLVISTAGV